MSNRAGSQSRSELDPGQFLWQGHWISADGRYIAFTSDAPDLSDRKFDPTRGVFVWDRASAETKLISKGFTVQRSNTRRILAAAALVMLARRALRRRRRLAVAGAG